MSILGDAQVVVRADMAQFSRDLTTGIDRAGKKISATGASLTNVGSQLTRSVTLPLLAAGGAAFKMASDFEASMTQITALVGIPREQVQAWEGDVRNLAVTYGKSATEASEALYFITSAGIDASDALDVLDTALKASAAGLGDTQTIADALTSVVNAYAASNVSAAEAADVLTAAVKFGKLEATELAPVLGRLLPTSSALNISFADVAGTLAVMSRTGLDAAEASTSLSSIMSTLLKPTAQSAKLLEANGLSMAALRNQAAGPDGLIGVMRTLDATFGDNDEALAQIVPNVRAFRGVMNVLAQDGATVDMVMQGVAGATGSLDTAFAEVSQTAKFQWNQTLSVAKDLMIEIGQTVMPIVVSALEVVRAKLTEVKGWWDGLSEGTQKFIVYAAGAAAALGPLLLGLGGVLKIVGPLVGSLGKLSALFGPWGIAIGLVVAGFAAMSGGADAITGIADQILGGIASVVEQLPTMIPKVIDAVMGIVMGIADMLPALVGAAGEIVIALVEGIATALPQLIPVAVTAIVTLVTAIVGMLPDLIDAGITAVLALVDGVLEALPVLIDTVVEAIPKLITAIVDMLPKLIDGGIRLVLGLVDGVVKALPKVIAAVVGAIPVLIRAIVGALPKIIQGGIQLVVGLVTGIVEALPSIITAIVDAIPLIVTAIIDAIPLLIEGGIQLVIGLVQGVIGAIPQLISAIVGAIPQIVVALAQGVWQLIQVGGTLISGLWDGIKATWTLVNDWFGGIPGKILDFWKNAGSWLLDAGKNIISGLWNGMKSQFEKVKSWVTGVGSWIKDHKGPEQYDKQLLVPAGGWIMEGLNAGLMAGVPDLKKTLEGISSNINVSPTLASVPQSSTGGAGGGFMIGNVSVTISITGVVDTKQAEGVGRAAANAAIRELSEKARLR